MKLEVCYIEGDISKRTLCEEAIFNGRSDDGVAALINANKPSIIVRHEDIVWIRPYEAPKRVRTKAGTQ